MSDSGESGLNACYAAPSGLEISSSFETGSTPSETVTLESDRAGRRSDVSIPSRKSGRTPRGLEEPSGSSKDLPSG